MISQSAALPSVNPSRRAASIRLRARLAWSLLAAAALALSQLGVAAAQTAAPRDEAALYEAAKQEGKLVWKIAPSELITDSTPWRFEGTPVIVAGRAYVALCRRSPQLELMVACLNASDGRLLWQQSIGSFRVSVDVALNRISHLLLTAGGGRIFLSTDAGAIVVDAGTHDAGSSSTPADAGQTDGGDTGTASGGCGCATLDPSALVFMALGALAITRRRRRVSRAPSSKPR